MATKRGLDQPFSLTRKPAFTLVELLVAVGCLGVLVALMVTCYGAIADESNKAACACQLRRLHAALRNYAELNRGYLPDTGAASTLAGPLPPDAGF